MNEFQRDREKNQEIEEKWKQAAEDNTEEYGYGDEGLGGYGDDGKGGYEGEVEQDEAMRDEEGAETEQDKADQDEMEQDEEPAEAEQDEEPAEAEQDEEEAEEAEGEYADFDDVVDRLLELAEIALKMNQTLARIIHSPLSA
jgi:hypothetical protein